MSPKFKMLSGAIMAAALSWSATPAFAQEPGDIVVRG